MRPIVCLAVLIPLASLAFADDRSSERQVIEQKRLHLRSAADREWTAFPEQPDGNRFERAFTAKKNSRDQTLFMWQQDVKQVWIVSLNEKKLGELVRDEDDMSVAFAIPVNALVDGENSLKIEAVSSNAKDSDDIRVGEISVVEKSIAAALSESTIDIEVFDIETEKNLPCQLTVLNETGSRQSCGTASNDHLAVRPGRVFTSTGRAKLDLPAGRYTIFAGRGFEYSLAQATVTVGLNERIKTTLRIRREVPTEGYVACDTHIHTLTHSGHGDARIEERMITIAAEGIELPIATDHNKHIDYHEAAVKADVRRYFTPVVGNEVTTTRGHFNIFPVAPGAAVVDDKQTDWRLLFADIQKTPGVKATILNHARDLHSGVRPFGPAHFNAVVAENLDGWPLAFNAMEVVNSGAVQSDPLRLFHDWMALLNRGLQVTPVGSSDSHDVARYLVGQGRTYIRCDDRDVANLDVAAAVANFVQGRVMVSYGLLTEITVNGQFHSGETATKLGETVRVDVRVLGPHWTQATQVQLFANGTVIKSEMVAEPRVSKPPTGIRWEGGWTIPRPQHDVHLVAIATGPGIDGLFWKTAKPYQPDSPDWNSRTIGCSGAVWLDADNDDRRTSARDDATRLVTAAGGDLEKLVSTLSTYDEAVAAQAAHLIRIAGTPLHDEKLQVVLKQATKATQSGFKAYRDAWRENEIARGNPEK